MEEQFKCEACGTSFQSQKELDDHGKEAHAETQKQTQ